MSEKLPKRPAGEPEEGERTPPRWSENARPHIPGLVSVEWNILTGVTWYSEEWKELAQDAVAGSIPNDHEWWSKHVSPEDLAKIYRSCMALHAGFVEESQTIFTLTRDDGTARTVLSRSRVTEKTKEGLPYLASGYIIDVTGLVSNGSVFHDSTSSLDYHSMLENSPDLFIRFDRNILPVYTNTAIERFLGGRAWKTRRLTGGYKFFFRQNLERVFREKAVLHDEVRLPMSDGTELVGACTFWPEFDEKGELRFAMVQFRDITEQRQMEHRLVLNERRLDALYRLTLMENASEHDVLRFVMDCVLQLSGSRSGFFFIPAEKDSDLGLLFWSDDHYDYVDRELLPSDHLPHDLVIQMSDENGRRVYRSVNNGNGVTPLYVVFGGKMVVMRGIITSVMEGNTMVCVAGVCNRGSEYDESDLQQLETFINSAWLILRRRRSVQELKKAKEAAEAANTAKNAFLANVSHELRTPLNGVLSMLQLIESLPLGVEQIDYLHTARASGKALLRIIADLLDYSSMEAGKLPLSTELFDFRANVLSALHMFAESASQKGVAYSYRVDPDIPQCLMGDEARVRQIIFNLVGNAIKFTPSGSIEVAIARGINGTPEKAEVTLEVRDTGIGIPRDKLEHIFEAFTQVENAHRRQYAGTGLGLSIVKHLVSLMDGRVEAESELGAGTTVRCTLYFGIPGEEEAARPLAERGGLKCSGKECLDILVAEDDTVGRKAIRAFLTKRGHRVVCVEDGRQALEALQLYSFDCLFSDITMPTMDGLELARRVRSGDAACCPPTDSVRKCIEEVFGELPLTAELPDRSVLIIAVSAHSMIGDKDRFLAGGMDYYISKPIDGKELDGALAYVVQRKM